MWRRPTLPARYQTSTIGSTGLNFRVRDENGWIPCDMVTTIAECIFDCSNCTFTTTYTNKSIFIILCVHYYLVLIIAIKPSTYQYQSAQRIATLTPLTYQPCGLQGVLLSYDMRYLILRWVSRLDAFSVYPLRTSLPSRATGVTTGAQQVRSSWSSRTRDKSSQISYAHDGQGPNCLTTF